MEDSFARSTGSSRILAPIKLRNSSGDISPSPLNRVISGFVPSFSMAFFFPLRNNNRWFSSCSGPGTAVSAGYRDARAGPGRDKTAGRRSAAAAGCACRRHRHRWQSQRSCSAGFPAVLNIQCGLQQVELLILVNDLFAQTENVQRFAFQAEYGLGVHIPGFGDGTAGGIALGDEDGGFNPAFIMVVVMDLAIAQFFVVQAGLFCTFPWPAF